MPMSFRYRNSRSIGIARFLLSGVLGAALSGCGIQTDQTGPQGLLKRGLAGEPASLDPAEASDNFSFQVLHDLYEGLTLESANGDVLPGVASSWAVDATGTEYTFHLREDARWSNGKP